MLVLVAVEPEVEPLPLVAPDAEVPVPVVPADVPVPVVPADVPVPVGPDSVVPLPVVVPVLPVVPELVVVSVVLGDVPVPTVALGEVMAPPLAPRVPPVVAPPPVTEFWLLTVPLLPAEAPAWLLRVEPLEAVCAMAPPAISEATRRLRSLLIENHSMWVLPRHNHCVEAWCQHGRRIGLARSDVGKLPSRCMPPPL